MSLPCNRAIMGEGECFNCSDSADERHAERVEEDAWLAEIMLCEVCYEEWIDRELLSDEHLSKLY